MYILSCEKCVCFIFLVMVAVLSCSGFRIDNLAMTDITKRNSYTSSTSDFFIETRSATTTQQPHRLRHSRSKRLSEYQQQQQQQQNSPYQRIIPAAVIRKQQKKKFPCQEQDVARKAYLADTVVLAKAESMSSNRVRNYSVSFRILERYKSPRFALVDDNLRLNFLNDTKRMNCESEINNPLTAIPTITTTITTTTTTTTTNNNNNNNNANTQHRHQHRIAKAHILPSKDYYLFLNSHGHHNYSVLGTPVLKRRKKNKELKTIQRVTSKFFEPKLKRVSVTRTTADPQTGKKVRLECNARGYPVPVIHWRKDEEILRNGNNTRITYSNKGRNSTLVIKRAQEKHSGRYTCVATSVDGKTLSKTIDIQIPNREECMSPYKADYCQNGGTCFYSSTLNEYSCVCPDGFKDDKCQGKEVSVNMDTSETAESYSDDSQLDPQFF